MERVCTGPPQRLEPALLPRWEQRGPWPDVAGGPLLAVGAAGQELHQRVGNPQEGRMAREAAGLPATSAISIDEEPVQRVGSRNRRSRILIDLKPVFVCDGLLKTRDFTIWLNAFCLFCNV